jgi:hypothetical protein
MAQLTQGTVEYLILEVEDRLNNLATLDGKGGVYSVFSDSGTPMYDEEDIQAQGLKAFCLINTSATHPQGLWPEGEYKIYLRFTLNPEIPRLGPYSFMVEA